jgi:hypothetical protein
VTRDLPSELNALVATTARIYAQEGNNLLVQILALASATAEEIHYDNWNGGQYSYQITLELPFTIFNRIRSEKKTIEDKLQKQLSELCDVYTNQHASKVLITTKMEAQTDWREKAIAWLAGEGVTNQGRVRSDNIASRECDGLLFRSQPEINLYRALKSLGVSFAPLPVFLRGGSNYQRIEPDFILIKDGIILHVEVDGDTVHNETPAEAHARTAILQHEGVYVERMSHTECETETKAQSAANKLLAVIAKHKSNVK